MTLQTADAAGSIVRAAVMPAPAAPASVQAAQAFANAPRVESAVSGAERSLHSR